MQLTRCLSSDSSECIYGPEGDDKNDTRNTITCSTCLGLQQTVEDNKKLTTQIAELAIQYQRLQLHSNKSNNSAINSPNEHKWDYGLREFKENAFLTNDCEAFCAEIGALRRRLQIIQKKYVDLNAANDDKTHYEELANAEQEMHRLEKEYVIIEQKFEADNSPVFKNSEEKSVSIVKTKDFCQITNHWDKLNHSKVHNEPKSLLNQRDEFINKLKMIIERNEHTFHNMMQKFHKDSTSSSEEMESLKSQLSDQSKVKLRMEQDLKTLREKYDVVMIENNELMVKINELTQQPSRYEEKETTNTLVTKYKNERGDKMKTIEARYNDKLDTMELGNSFESSHETLMSHISLARNAILEHLNSLDEVRTDCNHMIADLSLAIKKHMSSIQFENLRKEFIPVKDNIPTLISKLKAYKQNFFEIMLQAQKLGTQFCKYESKVKQWTLFTKDKKDLTFQLKNFLEFTKNMEVKDFYREDFFNKSTLATLDKNESRNQLKKSAAFEALQLEIELISSQQNFDSWCHKAQGQYDIILLKLKYLKDANKSLLTKIEALAGYIGIVLRSLNEPSKERKTQVLKHYEMEIRKHQEGLIMVELEQDSYLTDLCNAALELQSTVEYQQKKVIDLLQFLEATHDQLSKNMSSYLELSTIPSTLNKICHSLNKDTSKFLENQEFQALQKRRKNQRHNMHDENRSRSAKFRSYAEDGCRDKNA